MHVAVILVLLPTFAFAVLTEVNRCFTTIEKGIVVADEKCENRFKDGVCELLFEAPTNNGLTNATVDQRCYENACLSSGCSKRCLLCCEDPKYNCSNVADEEACAALQGCGGCEDVDLKELMIENCPKTCGFCDLQGKPLPEECPDKSEHCQTLLDYLPCKTDFMMQQCAKSCNLPCGTSSASSTTKTTQTATPDSCYPTGPTIQANDSLLMCTASKPRECGSMIFSLAPHVALDGPPSFMLEGIDNSTMWKCESKCFEDVSRPCAGFTLYPSGNCFIYPSFDLAVHQPMAFSYLRDTLSSIYPPVCNRTLSLEDSQSYYCRYPAGPAIQDGELPMCTSSNCGSLVYSLAPHVAAKGTGMIWPPAVEGVVNSTVWICEDACFSSGPCDAFTLYPNGTCFLHRFSSYPPEAVHEPMAFTYIANFKSPSYPPVCDRIVTLEDILQMEDSSVCEPNGPTIQANDDLPMCTQSNKPPQCDPTVFSIVPHVGLRGGAVRTVYGDGYDNSTVWKCEAECFSLTACTAFTFFSNNSNGQEVCYLYSRFYKAAHRPMAFSYMADPQSSSDYPTCNRLLTLEDAHQKEFCRYRPASQVGDDLPICTQANMPRDCKASVHSIAHHVALAGSFKFAFEGINNRTMWKCEAKCFEDVNIPCAGFTLLPHGACYIFGSLAYAYHQPSAFSYLADPLSSSDPPKCRRSLSLDDAVQSVAEYRKRPCDYSWDHFSGSCYLRTIEFLHYSSAASECELHASKLASIGSDDEKDFVAKLVGDTISAFVGLRKINGTWQWNDGTNETQTPSNNLCNHDGCVLGSLLNSGLLSARDDNGQLRAICEKNAKF